MFRLASLLLTCTVSAAGFGAATAAERITFGDWVLECTSQQSSSRACQLRQTLADHAGRRVLQLNLKRAGETAFLEAVTPLSISIPFGVNLLTAAKGGVSPADQQAWTAKINAPGAKPAKSKSSGNAGADTAEKGASAGTDKAAADVTPIALQLATCDPDGCRAVVAMNADLLARLKQAPRLAVQFQDSKTGKVLSIEASPKGLAEGAPLVLAAP